MEIWEQYGFPSEAEFYQAYPHARRKKHKRKRKWKRAIIRKGKIIASPPNMQGKYRAYPLLSERERETYRKGWGGVDWD